MILLIVILSGAPEARSRRICSCSFRIRSQPGAPGPGSPRTGLRPWGGDLDFETWIPPKPSHRSFV